MNEAHKHNMLGKYVLRWSFLRDALHAGYRGDYAVKGEIPAGSASKVQVLEETASDVTKLRDAVDQAQNILIQARAVFPFDLFPDTITVDRQKLTVVHRQFWGMKQTTSVPHADITNIQADIGPLFGSLTVTSEFFINNTQTIRYLPKHDVLAIQQLVQGFILASKGDIDTSNVDDKTLLHLLGKLGRGGAEERIVVQGRGAVNHN